MRTVSIFKNARNQAIRIPKDMEFEGVTELEIRREGDTLLDGVLSWDTAAVDATAAIRADLAARGTPIGANDASIAGHAIAAGAVLVTHNSREFARVAGLALEDWAA